MPIIYIGNHENPDDRLKIELDESEIERLPKRGDPSNDVVEVTDVHGTPWRVRAADCSIPGCRCALALVD